MDGFEKRATIYFWFGFELTILHTNSGPDLLIGII